MGRTVAVAVVALAMILGACGGSSPASPAGSQPAGPAQRASDSQGAFELTFGLPGTDFRAGQPIEGQATLGVVGGAPVAFGSSGGGPFAFDFAEVGGTRHVGAAMTTDCAPYRLEPGRPMTSAIAKSGSYSDDDPDAAFYRAFFADPTITLPAGRWRITAIASLVEGEGCSGASRDLAAAIVVNVVP